MAINGLPLSSNRMGTYQTGAQFLFGRELLVASVVKKDVTPLRVKKGSIIAVMQIMQCDYLKQVYPVSFEVFPASKNKEASFELYDDGMKSMDQKDIYCKTSFTCLTEKEGYTLKVSQKIDDSYNSPGDRNFVFHLHIPKEPQHVLLAGKKLKSIKLTTLTGSSEKQVWYWDKNTKICSIIIPDNGLENILKVVKKIKLMSLTYL